LIIHLPTLLGTLLGTLLNFIDGGIPLGSVRMFHDLLLLIDEKPDHSKRGIPGISHFPMLRQTP
jgi:hypothetical protein